MHFENFVTLKILIHVWLINQPFLCEPKNVVKPWIFFNKKYFTFAKIFNQGISSIEVICNWNLMHVMPLKVSGSILKYKYYILYKDNRFTKGIKFCLLWNKVKTLSLVRRSKLVKSQYIKNQKRNIWLKNMKENFKAGNNLKKKKKVNCLI